MKLWKRNAVVAVIVLFVCMAVYLNWSYSQEPEVGVDDAGKTLGQAALVGTTESDPLLATTASPAPVETEAPAEQTENYFASARLNRQQARDSALGLLQQAATDQLADQTAVDAANMAIQTMADYTLAEAQIENLVTAKGYADCVAFLNDNSISVVVSGVDNGLQATDTAKISEIVMEETALEASQIKIIEVSGD